MSWRRVWSARVHDDRGVTAVILAVVLVAVIGVLALSVDGGLLWVKYRNIRNANDAAALAAALGCAKGDGLAAADTSANAAAAANASDAAALEANAYTPSCNPNAGQVHVRYGGEQELMFGPAVGISSPKPVVASATAAWGGAGGADDVVPLILMKDRLSSCNVIPEPGKPVPAIGTQCGFWWDNSALGNATWGLMALDSWGTTSAASGCSAAGGVTDITNAIINGVDHSLVMNAGAPAVPTYVCAKNGNSINPIDDAIRTALTNGRTDFAMPVNNPAMQVNVGGAPYKYAIIGWAFVRPVDIYQGNKASDAAGFAKCAGVIPPGADVRGSFCLVVSWQGYSYQGLVPGGGPNFGLSAVGLSQ